GLGAELLDAAAATVAHAGAQAADELVHRLGEAAPVRDPALDPLGDQLHVGGGLGLEVAVLAAGPHGPHRAHAPVLLVAAPLVKDDLARRLVGAGEQAADHHRVGAGGQGLGHVARVLDAAVRDDADVQLLDGAGAVGDRGDLGDTDAGHHAGGADR